MVWRTTFITVATCFLLGTTFTHWIADHNVLWHSPLTAEALETSISYYSILSSAPRWLGWVYIVIGGVALASAAGRMVKGFKRYRGEVVFDGGSVVLLAAIAYTQISEVFPTISLIPHPLPEKVQEHPLYPALLTAVRDLANSNVITAVMLTGVMLLQAGRYYAKRPSSSPESIASAPSSGPSTPPQVAVDHSAAGKHSPIAERAATPFRELTEEEAMELQGLGGRSAGKRKNKKR